MALGNVFIKDVDGNIPYDTGSSGEKVTGLLFRRVPPADAFHGGVW